MVNYLVLCMAFSCHQVSDDTAHFAICLLVVNSAEDLCKGTEISILVILLSYFHIYAHYFRCIFHLFYSKVPV